MPLTHDVDLTYPDAAGDPSIQAHQADHDLVHRALWLPHRRVPERIRPAVMIWGGQAGHGWTGTGAGATFNLDDTTDIALGTRSMRIQTPGTATPPGTQTFIQKLAIPAVDITNRTVVMWIKVDNYNAGCDLRVWLGSSGSAWTNYLNWSWTDGDTNKIYPVGGGWVQLVLPRSRAATVGTPTLTALTDVRVTTYDGGVGVPMVTHFGGIGLVPDGSSLYPNGVVSLTFDDGLADHYTEAKAYLDSKGAAGTCYPIIGALNTSGYMTTAQLKALVSMSGWEMGLHAYTNANHDGVGGITALSPSDQVKDIVQSKEWLLANGFRDTDNYAYPQGIFNHATADNLRPWISSARTTKSRPTSAPGPGGETFPPSDRMKMYQRALSNTDTLANITAFVDAIKANKEWLIMTFHGIRATPPSTGTTPAIFQGFVDYVIAQGVPFRTVGEVLAVQSGA